MSERLPIIYSAHHASHNFGVFNDRIQLSPEQRVRYSDYGTSETVPTNGEMTLIADYSRGIVDLNRAPHDPSLFPTQDFGKPMANNIWKPGEGLTDEEKSAVLKEIYESYHNRILNTVRTFDRPGLVIAWDNTAHYTIGSDKAGTRQEMKPIILSNRGAEGSTEADPKSGEATTCDADFLLEFGHQFHRSLAQRGLPSEIFYNFVFQGGYITQRYNTYRHPDVHESQPIQSFQVEYDTLITHDQDTLQPKPKAIAALKTSFEEAMYRTYTSNF